MQFTMSLLVWPSSLASLFVLSWKAYKEKQLVQSLPLLLSQLNTAFIWMCLASYQIGAFTKGINGKALMNGDSSVFRNYALTEFLQTAIFLEPLNLFFYTWRFWATLAEEETNKYLKSFYFWFSWGSICLIPATFFGVLAGYVVAVGRFFEYTV